MIDALIAGKLHSKPVAHTGKSGKPFVTAKVRVATTADESIFVSVISFSQAVITALLALDSGDSVSLSGTLMDRAVILELRRKLSTESVIRLRHADPAMFSRLASKLARLAADNGDWVAQSRPVLPSALNDRAQDNWEPLLSLADLAGGVWPKRARDAALKLSGADQEEVSLSVELLVDIKAVFDGSLGSKVSTADLLQALVDAESAAFVPWAESDGRGDCLSGSDNRKAGERFNN